VEFRVEVMLDIHDAEATQTESELAQGIQQERRAKFQERFTAQMEKWNSQQVWKEEVSYILAAVEAMWVSGTSFSSHSAQTVAAKGLSHEEKLATARRRDAFVLLQGICRLLPSSDFDSLNKKLLKRLVEVARRHNLEGFARLFQGEKLLRRQVTPLVEFQLRHAPEHIQRPSGQPDQRVTKFVPDEWQVHLLNVVDTDQSALVVAPTSSDVCVLLRDGEMPEGQRHWSCSVRCTHKGTCQPSLR